MQKARSSVRPLLPGLVTFLAFVVVACAAEFEQAHWIAPPADRATNAAGPLFRSLKNGRPTSRALDGRDLARVVQAAAARAGLAGDLAGHSLRAGLITQAARQGKAERDIMRHTGHRSAATLRRYIRAGELFASSNPAQGIGL